MQFKKYLYITRGGSKGFTRGRGVVRATILKEKYDHKLEFPGKVGFKLKSLYFQYLTWDNIFSVQP